MLVVRQKITLTLEGAFKLVTVWCVCKSIEIMLKFINYKLRHFFKLVLGFCDFGLTLQAFTPLLRICSFVQI